MPEDQARITPRRVILQTVLDAQRGTPSILGEIVMIDGERWKVVVISLDNMVENNDKYTVERID